MKYKILTLLTLILPISSFLLISTITGQTYDAEIYKYEDSSVIEFIVEDDYYIVYSEKASYTGYLVPYNEEYALMIEDNEVIKIDRDYYTPYFNEDTQKYELTNYDDIPAPVEQSNKWVVSIATLIAIGIVALIIGSKMDVLKKHPRVSILVSLAVLTLVFWGLNSIISDMLNVFVIATASWFGYCIEYLIHTGNISKEDGEKAQSNLLTALKEVLNE